MNKVFKLLLFAVCIAFVGCNNQKSVVKIGVIASLTGTGSSAAQYCIDGLELALNELNSIDNGIKYELVYEDSQSNPSLAGNCFKRLEMQGAKYIIALGGQFALVVAPMTKGKNMIYFTTGDYNEAVLSMTDCGLRVFPSASTFGDISAQFLLDSLRVTRVATISMNTVPCLQATNRFEDNMRCHGGEIVFQDKYDIGTSDFKNTIAKMANTGVQAVFFNGFGISPAAFCSQLAQYPQFDNLIVMGDVNFSLNSFIDNNNNEKLRIYYADTEMTGDAAQRYYDKYGNRPNSYVSCCYMLPYLINRAILSSDSTADFATQRSVLTGQLITTPAGPIAFDEIGNAQLGMTVFSLK